MCPGPGCHLGTGHSALPGPARGRAAGSCRRRKTTETFLPRNGHLMRRSCQRRRPRCRAFFSAPRLRRRAYAVVSSMANTDPSTLVPLTLARARGNTRRACRCECVSNEHRRRPPPARSLTLAARNSQTPPAGAATEKRAGVISCHCAEVARSPTSLPLISARMSGKWTISQQLQIGLLFTLASPRMCTLYVRTRHNGGIRLLAVS